MVPEEKNPVDQVLDLLVFAPLGLATTARTQLPEMVAKGRAQVEAQVSMARFIGQFAVKQGKVEVEKRLKAYTAPRPTADPTIGPASAAPPSEDPPTVSVPVTVRVEPASDVEPLDGPPPAAAGLAIPGYDALSASQVVQRLAGLSVSELEQVRRYEAATRRRKTVLTKISQLQ
jgi:hypothetical protein